MGLFDRWFGAGVTDPTVAARQRAAAWGVFLAQQRAALPPRPVDGAAPLATAPVKATMPVTPALSPPIAPPTTVLVIEDGEAVV